MKRTILLISLIYSITVYPQTGTAIYSISGTNTINVNNNFIDTFYIHNGGNGTTPYTLKKQYPLTGMNAAYGQFTVKISKYKGYEDEAGIGNVVQLYRDNTCLVILSGSNGFTSLSSYVGGVTGDFLFKKLADDTYILIFTEWIYASQPPMVSIVLIYKDNAKLIFNKERFINSIKLTPFEMEIQTNTVEYINDNTPANTADFHKIWWEENLLRYK